MARETDFAQRDLYWAGAFVLLLFLGARWIFFLYVAVAVVAGLVVALLVRRAKRRKAERANADKPFWADRL